jgi:hypothetical protein
MERKTRKHRKTHKHRKTRKHCKKTNANFLAKQHINAKKATQIKCLMKTCRAKKYQSVYGSSIGGSVRSNRNYFL